MRAILSAMIVAAAVWCFTSTAAAQDYEIRLHRPFKAGDRFQMSVEARDSKKATTTVNGQPFKESLDESVVEFEAGVKITEVDGKGRPLRVQLNITKFLKVDGQDRTPLLAKGSVVMGALIGGKSVYEQDGTPVGEDAQKALRMVVSLGGGGATDDDIFGTSDRKKVGQRWSIEVERAAEDLKTKGLGVKKEDLTGTATLEKVVRVADTECLQIALDISVAQLSVPTPAGFAFDKVSLVARGFSIVPVNPALGIIQQTLDMTMKLVMKGRPKADGPEVVVDMVTQNHKDTRYIYPR